MRYEEYIQNFSLALGVYTSAFSQITEITRLPVQDISQSINESAPVWLSENEIMVFYVNETKDTIFSTQSTNRGITWSQPKFQFKVELLQQTQELIYPAAFKSKSGRLILAWSVLNKGINLTYSDDNGITWSSIQVITGVSIQTPFIRNYHFIKITQLADESLTLCFNPQGDQGTLYYKQSTDDGQTWSETAKRIVTTGGYRYDEHTVISADPNTLICVFKYRATLSSPYHIGARYSYDNGVSWGEILNLSGNSTNEIFPGITKDNSGNLWLVFVRMQKYTFESSLTYEVGDIYYRKSSDNGFTWTEEKQFTKYIGDDSYTSVNSSGKAPFVCYSTQKFTGKNQISFGVLDETLEKYTPPHLFHLYSPSNVSSSGFTIRAFVKDDNQVETVNVNLKESDAAVELFDDGLHQDLEANDGVYGNAFSLYLLPANENYFFSVNKIQLPLSNMGSISGTTSTYDMNTLTTLSDSNNNSNTFEKKVQVYLPSLGIFEEGDFLFAGGFFLSGFTNGSLWSNAVALASLVQDYLSGTVGSIPSDPKFNFYVVRKDDTPFGSSWQRWKDAVEVGAEFYDGDGDGIYNPEDKTEMERGIQMKICR